MPENGTPGRNGRPAHSRQVMSTSSPGRWSAHDPAVERGTRLATMSTRQLSGGPGAPGGWSRFLLAHLRWILVITLVCVGMAVWYVRHQTPLYQAQAAVNVWFATPSPAALQGPNMVTEKGIVSSAAILSIASSNLGVPQAELRRGLSVSVPAGSSIMDIGYADPVPWIARERAQTIALAYVQYRTPVSPPAASKNSKTSAQAVTALHATLITPAVLPTSPSSPKTLLDILAALFLGVALAVGSAALRDHLDDRFRGPLDLEARTGAPALALVPAFRTLSRDPSAELAVLWSPDSVIAEAYRNLRTRVLTEAAARGAKTLLVTSPGWEKKGTVAANLAVALAQSGRRTILVCADLRWGSAHELLGVSNREGLTTVLDGRSDTVSALQSRVNANLRVLAPGPLPADPAEILQRSPLRTVIGSLRNQCDFVVIEAPPLLASPDVTPLAQRAEMLLLVGDARRTTRAHTLAALREAGDAGRKLIGCALYDVGRRHLLRRSPAPVPGERSPASDDWPGPDDVDGHETALSSQHVTYVRLPAGNSPTWPPEDA